MLPPAYEMILAFPHNLASSAVYKRVSFPSRHHHHPCKRSRLKPFSICSHFNASSLISVNIFHSLLSQIPSLSYLDYIAPTLGFASGLALYLSSKSRKANPEKSSDFDSSIGEWILFSSPTPFNRFVVLRCPSICFPGGELLENVKEKLVEEDTHFVNSNRGRIVLGKSEEDGILEKVAYQRLCVVSDGGGVLSLDWPANLELEEERGLDTTILIVPGTAEGSYEGKIKRLVCECLRRGVFPVVMNPRGCAGSPLTTPRLFTAADSDDIFTAVQFIHKKRPWTTFMSVGWGYGANMLTKYLAEYGERTPLTAAICIDNPFDLEAATRLTMEDMKLTGGLVSILQRNKELFQGRGKRFDVEKALLASSIRDFDSAISMVSHGFDNVDDFYGKSSTLDVVGKVKIPVFFIQNDDGTFPMFSVPRGLIAENPYTSLLLCSYLSLGRDSGLYFSWCLNLAIEWLSAVELGLLKGRHPLLKDVDVTVNPLKGLTLLGGKASSKSDDENKLLNFPNGYSAKNSTSKMLETYDTKAKLQSRSARDIGRMPPQTEGRQAEGSDVGRQLNASDTKIEDEASKSSENERGQVLQTVEVVMNMLDVTMPETLSEEQKKKVLDAVGQGEMLMKALEDAVPEDVRGKLTSSVSEIVQSQRSNIKFNELLKLGHIPYVAPGVNSKLQEKIGLSRGSDDEALFSDQNKRSNEAGDGPHVYMELANQQSEEHEKSKDSGLSQSTGSQLDDNLATEKNKQNELIANHEFSGQNKGPGESQNISNTLKETERENVEGQSNLKENDNEDAFDVSNDQSEVKEADHINGSSGAPSSTETQPAENEAENNQEKKGKDPQPVSSQINAAPSSFNMSQALEALTGFDDSTQVAVNSVFQAIEGMFDQLQVKREDQNQVKDESDKLDFNRRDMEINLREGTPNLKDLDHDSESVYNLWRNPGVPGYLAAFPYGDPLYKEYLKARLLSELRKFKPAVLDAKSALPLNYFPEDGRWRLLEQIDDGGTSGEKFTTHEGGSRASQIDSDSRSKYTSNIIEPSFVILDSGKQQKINEEFEEMNIASEHTDFGELDKSMLSVKNIIVECLNVEVSRRVSADMEELKLEIARDIEHVANAVSLAARREKEDMCEQNDHPLSAVGSLHSENIMRAISFAIEDTQYLKRVLPVGVIVGSSLASLRKFFNASAFDSNGENDANFHQVQKSDASIIPVDKKEANQRLPVKYKDESSLCPLVSKDDDKITFQRSNDNKVMLGAVTAALGASALLIGQQNTETGGSLMDSLEEEENSEDVSKLEEMPERAQKNVVTSLAEKAMSVASPVVPTTEDGEVDHARLVAMLAELGQKGGILRLVGKVALLWGGIRGAMSVTDRLISFLHFAERTLFQRIIGFIFMVLLLWSPVVIPLFPSLMRSWTTQNPFKIVELTCITGLYISVMIMVVMWGKRIRKYDDPLLQYGLDFTSIPKFKNFSMGLAGGAMLVLLIQLVSSLLGCVQLRWPTTLSSPYSEPVTLMKSYASMLLLIVQGIATATGVATVEELLFRSWLPEEISTDFGYHRGIIISGLAFSLSQRSIWEIPGLWLLSLSLSGARQQSEGSLSLPVGIRTGILACSFILKTGGFLTYRANLPLWFRGGHPSQPFSGVVGVAFSLLLAIIMYPRQSPLHKTKNKQSKQKL
ncbi:uncharacterized protein LOC142545661 isoform X2 [Primulina tabacum]|uniref:uncharacterized protein LOC142545661 isoform X2 n=1 Tax=Primulina tabacum TaxID=48773 RepID=UPI003F5A04CA